MDSAAPQRRARKPGQTGCGGPAQRRVGRAHQGIAAAEDHAHEEQEDEHLHGVAGHHAIPGLVAHTRQRRTSLAAVGGSFFSCAGEQAHPKSCFLKPLKLPRLQGGAASLSARLPHKPGAAGSGGCGRCCARPWAHFVSIIHRKSTRLGGMEKLMLSAVARPLVASRPYEGTFTRLTWAGGAAQQSG